MTDGIQEYIQRTLSRKPVMPSRRQEKVARVIKEAVSIAITNDLNDPRISGFVSVTRVDVTANLRRADVYLSIFGTDEKAQNRTFIAIEHAKKRIQSHLAAQMQSKFCPVLHFSKDDVFKKTLDIMKLIDQATAELNSTDSNDDSQD